MPQCVEAQRFWRTCWTSGSARVQRRDGELELVGHFDNSAVGIDHVQWSCGPCVVTYCPTPFILQQPHRLCPWCAASAPLDRRSVPPLDAYRHGPSRGRCLRPDRSRRGTVAIRCCICRRPLGRSPVRRRHVAGGDKGRQENIRSLPHARSIDYKEVAHLSGALTRRTQRKQARDALCYVPERALSGHCG